MKRTLFPTHALFYKAILIFSLMLLFQMNSFAQGPKWATLGNTTATGDFIGPVNFQPLVFKTDNITRGAFTETGNFQLNNLIGVGNRFLQTDADGNIIPFEMGDPMKVLYGNGIWGALPTIPASFWSNAGGNIYYLGKVGIGTSTPIYPLDVIGDVRISNNLYVGGGIVITDKVNANAEVVTGKMRADSIVTDSTKGFYGTSKFNGDVKLQNKLDVTGNTVINGTATVNGNFKTMGSLTFAGNQTISYTPASTVRSPIFSIGSGGPPRPPGPCWNPTLDITITDLMGVVQASGNNINGGQFNTVFMGFDGSDGILDVQGISNGAPPRLLLNYNCGHDVEICNGPLGGNILMSAGAQSKVGIGTTSIPSGYKLAVKGNIIAEDLTVQLFADWPWPDYVFDSNYKIMTWEDRRNYINSNHHLPYMKSAEEVQKAGGATIGETTIGMLRNIEEYDQYINQIKKENSELKKKNEENDSKMNELTTSNFVLNKMILEQNKKIEAIENKLEDFKK